MRLSVDEAQHDEAQLMSRDQLDEAQLMSTR